MKKKVSPTLRLSTSTAVLFLPPVSISVVSLVCFTLPVFSSFNRDLAITQVTAHAGYNSSVL